MRAAVDERRPPCRRVLFIPGEPAAAVSVDACARRRDPVGVEGAANRVTIVEARVVGRDFGIRGEQRRDVASEREIHGRTIVEGADGHRQQVACHLAALLDDGVEVAIAAREGAELPDAARPDVDEGAEKCRAQELTALVWLVPSRTRQIIRPRGQLH
jgi:hypothetical protein